MVLNVLVISTSLRDNSNTEILADEFIRGAIAGGHKIEKISLKNKKINFCNGCEVCQKTEKCIFQDDATEIINKLHDSDVVVFAAPVYFGGASGQMHTLLDRTYTLMQLKQNIKQTHKFKDVYLITASADEGEEFTDFVVNNIKEWIKSFDGTYRETQTKSRLAGVIRGLGVWDAGKIRNKPDKMKEAYELGKSISSK